MVKHLYASKKSSLLLIAALLFASLIPSLGAQAKPLWPGARYTDQDREQALERGLQFIGKFIGKIASDPKYFERQGYDLLWCFYTISTTARSDKLRAMAREMGVERARQWRHDHPQVPTGDPEELAAFVSGEKSVDLGDPQEEDVYTRYHATWTAIDGLREYAFQKQRTVFPAVLHGSNGKSQRCGTEHTEHL